jgi:hypothetical protein
LTLLANLREQPGVFQRLFGHPRCEELFSKLCESGCSEKDLAILLLAASAFALENQSELLDTGGLSPEELARLKRDLISLAGLVDRVNKSTLNPKFDLLSAPPDVSRNALRQITASLYDMLPGLMQTYSVHLGQFSKFAKANLRHMTLGHIYALKLLRYIREKTGSPRYDDCANLLIAGFLAVGGAEEDIPDFFTAEALAKLNQRTAKLRY